MLRPTGFAALLAACINVALAQAPAAPEAVQQAVPQPGQAPSVQGAQLQGGQLLTLRAALARAIAQDPQVAIARAQRQAAQAVSRQARARYWPSAGVTANYGKGTDTEPPNIFDRTTNRGEAFLRWNLFNGFSDRTLIETQQLEEAAAQAELLRALDDACERLGQAFYELQRQQQLADLARVHLEEVERTVQRVVRQAELGKGSDADAQLAASSRIDARLSLHSIEADHAAAQSQLRVLLGEPGDGPLRVAEEAPLQADAAQPLQDWHNRAEHGNGQWLAAIARAAAAQARVGRIAPEYLPRVDLDLRRQLHNRTTPQNTSLQQRGWSLALTYEVPLGGAPAARRDESRARAEAAEAEVRRVRNVVFTDIGLQRQQALNAREAATQLARQREHLDAVVRAGVLQFDAGRRSLQQLIEQQERRFAVQQRDVDNTWRRATSQLRLRLLAGDLAEEFGVEP